MLSWQVQFNFANEDKVMINKNMNKEVSLVSWILFVG